MISRSRVDEWFLVVHSKSSILNLTSITRASIVDQTSITRAMIHRESAMKIKIFNIVNTCSAPYRAEAGIPAHLYVSKFLNFRIKIIVPGVEFSRYVEAFFSLYFYFKTLQRRADVQ